MLTIEIIFSPIHKYRYDVNAVELYFVST